MPGPNLPSLPDFTAVLFGLSGCLVDFGARAAHLPHDSEHALASLMDQCAAATPGALDALCGLHRHNVTCGWLECLPEPVCARLTTTLPHWLNGISVTPTRPWPAPEVCWQALAHLAVDRLEGCVLVASDIGLLQAGLAAGLWTVGLVTCGPLGGQADAWRTLEKRDQERLRAQATLQLYNVGVHSVIDDLQALDACLNDIARRRAKGEKP